MTRGMPYINVREYQQGMSMIEMTRDRQNGISMIKTARKNFKGVTKKQLNKAIMARVLQRRIGHPPEERYKEIVSLHADCPVSVTDITNARVIFGPNVSGLRGRTVRDTAVVPVKDQRVAIPKDFY